MTDQNNLSQNYQQAGVDSAVNSPVSAYQPPAQVNQTWNSTNTPVSSPDVAGNAAAATQPDLAATTAVSSSSNSAANNDQDGEALEDQNVFVLLGVNSGTEDEKEQFLDELQQVIWDDFVENDVALLVTAEEMLEVKKVTQDAGLNPSEKQEKMIDYLEKLIPDLEEIMLEKALELKEEMVRERINGLRDLYREDQVKMQKLDQAEKMMMQDKWKSLADILNTVA